MRLGAFCRRCGSWRGCLGLEPDPNLYVEHLVGVLREVRRVLRDDGVMFLNMGDGYASGKGSCYNPGGGDNSLGRKRKAAGVHPLDRGNKSTLNASGLKPKDLLLMPARVALALQADGWWLRSAITWCKGSAMPESVQDRPTSATEMVYLLAKQKSYFWDATAVREGVPAVVQRPNPLDEAVIFLKNRGLEEASAIRAWSPASLSDARLLFEVCVRLASALFDLTQSQKQLGLFTLDAEERQQFIDNNDSVPVGCAPVIHRATVLASLFLHSNVTAKHFLEELNGLGITLPDSNIFRVVRATIEGADPPSIDGDGDAPVGVQDACEIGENLAFVHHQQYTSNGATSQGRNLRNWWLINPQPYPGAHFATFPEALVTPCIMAGSSEHGCCPECGAPWTRVVERTAMRIKRSGNHPPELRTRTSGTMLEPAASRTLGWKPTCAHGHEPTPCRILDCFSGSGTVGVVAERLGRHSVLIDAKEEYCQLARHRTAQRGLMNVTHA